MTETLMVFTGAYQHPNKKRRKYAYCESKSWERGVASLEHVLEEAPPYKGYRMVYVKRHEDITR